MGVSEKFLPDGPVQDSSVWMASDFANDRSWIYELTEGDRAEIDAAVARLKSESLAPPSYTREQFRIPALAARIEKIVRRLENGPGFFLLRGIPVERHDLDTIKMIYWGLGMHLGVPVFQNARGQLLTHVEDKGDDYGDANTRLYTTAAAANPHNDPSDVVGLLCVRKSPAGGASMIASAGAIYNEVRGKHPEYLEVLRRGFPHAVRGEGKTQRTDETTHDIPVYSWFGGKLSCCLNSKSSRTARELQDKPFTPIEIETVNFVESLVEDPRFVISMDFRPGDAQFLNNYAILHTRTSFQDGRALGERRLLLRLWLNLREGRPLAPGFGDRFNNGSRGGVPAEAIR